MCLKNQRIRASPWVPQCISASGQGGGDRERHGGGAASECEEEGHQSKEGSISRRASLTGLVATEEGIK